MTRTRSLALLSVTCGILLAGCDPANTAPTAPPAAPAAPRPNFVNGPAQAGIVVRFTTTDAGIFIVDRASGVVVVEGIPPDPTTLALACPSGSNSPLT